MTVKVRELISRIVKLRGGPAGAIEVWNTKCKLESNHHSKYPGQNIVNVHIVIYIIIYICSYLPMTVEYHHLMYYNVYVVHMSMMYMYIVDWF